MKGTTFGLDLAKRVFQLHWVDVETGEIGRRMLNRWFLQMQRDPQNCYSPCRHQHIYRH